MYVPRLSLRKCKRIPMHIDACTIRHLGMSLREKLVSSLSSSNCMAYLLLFDNVHKYILGPQSVVPNHCNIVNTSRRLLLSEI
jgi:hypothetical protein